jgi:hypothetical protein
MYKDTRFSHSLAKNNISAGQALVCNGFVGRAGKPLSFRAVAFFALLTALIALARTESLAADDKKGQDDPRGKNLQEEKNRQIYVNSYEQLRKYQVESCVLELQVAASFIAHAGPSCAIVPSGPIAVSATLAAKRKEVCREIDFHEKTLSRLRQSLQNTELLKSIEKELGIVQ